MNICLLSYRGNPYSGGQGIYLKYIAEELVRQGHTVHAVVGPPYPLEMKGVAVHTIENNNYYIKKGFEIINGSDPFDVLSPLNFYEYLHTRLGAFSEISSFGYRAFLLLRKLHEKYRYDIIHDNQSLGYGLLFMKALGIPVIATIHHPLTIDLENVMERVESFKKRVKSVVFYPILMQQFVSKRLDHIIAVSENSRIRICRDFGVPLERQSVIYNGIDRSVFHPVTSVKKKNGNVIFVGNIEDGKKGFIYLLKALTLMKRKVHLTAVDGGAPHRKITDRLLAVLNLKDRIEFTGKIDTGELLRRYSEAEIAVVPSVHEGFGFPAGEAMACGVPVIASDGGALPEVVGDAGIVVPSRDEKTLAEAMDSLICDRKRMKTLGEMGMERVREKFSWRKSAEKMVGVYGGLVGPG